MPSKPQPPAGGGNGSSPEATPPPAHSPLQLLEHLLQVLQRSRQVPEQIRHTLEAVREGTQADVVFWYPAAGGPPVVLGHGGLGPESCQRFLQRLLDLTGGTKTHLLWVNPQEPAADATVTPQSAALVRVGTTDPNWLVAVSLDRQRRLRAADLELLSLARRLLLRPGQHDKLLARFKDSLVGLIQCLTAVIDAKDPCTAGHSERVARIGVLLGRQMGLSNKEVSDVFLAGLLHDIGKISVPDAILQKNGRLTQDEFARIQEHVVVGDRILSGMRQLDHLRPGVRGHHERYDGKGYPDGLAGTKIPVLARLLAVADACDAMMSSRHYRPAIAPPRIDAIFQQGAGSQWDPEIIEHFMACRFEIYPPIYQKGIGESAQHAIEQVVEDHSAGSSLYLPAFRKDEAGSYELRHD